MDSETYVPELPVRAQYLRASARFPQQTRGSTDPIGTVCAAEPATDPFPVAAVDLCGVLRRVRRSADMSQRELARACHVSQSAVAHAESGERDLPVGVLSRAAACAGLRIALLDGNGNEVGGMADD